MYLCLYLCESKCTKQNPAGYRYDTDLQPFNDNDGWGGQGKGAAANTGANDSDPSPVRATIPMCANAVCARAHTRARNHARQVHLRVYTHHHSQ